VEPDRPFVDLDDEAAEPLDPSDEPLDPNDSDMLRDQLKGETSEHAQPPRLEDEGQPGG
jgi:hypothetical protein